MYLFFEGAEIRIPFYNYDRNLFRQLAGSGLGRWDHAAKHYSMSSHNYNDVLFKNVCAGTPFVEVSKDPKNPVIVHDFLGREKQSPDDGATEEHYTAPGMYCALRELPGQFPASWREKLDTELRARKYSPNTRAAYIHHNEALCQWLQKTPESVTDEDIKRYLAYKEKVGEPRAFLSRPCGWGLCRGVTRRKKGRS
jgi:hypothetical protein